MSFDDFFFLNLGDSFFIVFDLKEFESAAVSLQLSCLPLSPVAILVAANVYASIVSPGLPLSIESSLFVDLNGIVLAATWLLILFSLQEAWAVEVSQVAAISWSAVLHKAQLIAVAIAIETNERAVVQSTLVKNTDSSEWVALV